MIYRVLREISLFSFEKLKQSLYKKMIVTKEPSAKLLPFVVLKETSFFVVTSNIKLSRN